MHFDEIQPPDWLGEKVDLPIKTQKLVCAYMRLDLIDALPGGLGNQVKRGIYFRITGTKAILGKREHKKTKF